MARSLIKQGISLYGVVIHDGDYMKLRSTDSECRAVIAQSA
jgi:hypothetical protein